MQVEIDIICRPLEVRQAEGFADFIVARGQTPLNETLKLHNKLL